MQNITKRKTLRNIQTPAHPLRKQVPARDPCLTTVPFSIVLPTGNGGVLVLPAGPAVQARSGQYTVHKVVPYHGSPCSPAPRSACSRRQDPASARPHPMIARLWSGSTAYRGCTAENLVLFIAPFLAPYDRKALWPTGPHLPFPQGSTVASRHCIRHQHTWCTYLCTRTRPMHTIRGRLVQAAHCNATPAVSVKLGSNVWVLGGCFPACHPFHLQVWYSGIDCADAVEGGWGLVTEARRRSMAVQH